MTTLATVIGKGAIGSRPAAASAGRLYFSTEPKTYRDNGSSWDDVSDAGTPGNLTGDVTSVGLATTIGAGKVTEAMQVLANNTTGNVSTSKHGYAPILPNDATKYLDGTGAYSVPPGSGGGASASSLGYNTVGGSQQAMTVGRVYCKQITAGGSGNELLGIQAYLDQTAEATLTFSFSLYADSGSDTIGDLLFMAHPSVATVFAHGTGGGVSYPARWFGTGVGYPLTASTKYWIGVAFTAGTGAPRLYYDGSGSDRYYVVGTGSYHNDGAYNAGTQTNTTNKHSIRARVL